MGISIFPDFIKHYDLIRSILRDVFLYGCFSKGDLESKNHGSSRKVSYEMRRIKQYIEKDFIKIDKDGKNKLLSLSYDDISNTKNFLVNTYLSKSFTKADIILYYYLLLILNYKNKPMAFSDIENELVSEELIDYENISSKTIERKLNELANSMEIVSVKKNGRVKEYYISEDILKELDNEEILKLYNIVDLYKNIIFPNVSGHYFFDTLRDYLEFERNVIPKDKNCFQYKNLHFHPVIEEELILKVMRAIENRNEIRFKNDCKTTRVKMYDNEVIRPFKLRYDVECGRFYVFSFTSTGRCISARLDRKDDIEVLKTRFNYEEYEEKYKLAMEKSFSSVPHNTDTPYEEVEFEVNIDSLNEYYIVEKIKGELGDCTFEKISDTKYLFKKIVNDSCEMIPWIRKYGGYLKVISPRYLHKKIKKDWEDMLNNYGVIS
ncbi:helix-turn-helix transcriptional regulator [Clostridium beijerinckii]|uniref:helix-turn-helix transcriptional regulator n=1 Tax=Clostridium beijerinckii TaxID=1520 RepID=UPI0003646EF6|nr:WYL domain-containing protein [Clostridium beijerinckii]